MSDEDIAKQAEHLAAVVAEKLESQAAMIVENLDSRIEHRIAPLQAGMDTMQSDMKAMKVALTDTNHDLNTFKEDMGADMKLVKAGLRGTQREMKTTNTNLYKLLYKLDERVSQLEEANV